MRQGALFCEKDASGVLLYLCLGNSDCRAPASRGRKPSRRITAFVLAATTERSYIASSVALRTSARPATIPECSRGEHLSARLGCIRTTPSMVCSTVKNRYQLTAYGAAKRLVGVHGFAGHL